MLVSTTKLSEAYAHSLYYRLEPLFSFQHQFGAAVNFSTSLPTGRSPRGGVGDVKKTGSLALTCLMRVDDGKRCDLCRFELNDAVK